jgi:hypothetical protein
VEARLVPGVGAVRPPGGFGAAGAFCGGETDAIEEVRVRMPMRHLGGEIVGPGEYLTATTVLVRGGSA